MKANELVNGARLLRRKITESGSPFRDLRKGALYLSRPADTFRRISVATAATRNVERLKSAAL